MDRVMLLGGIERIFWEQTAEALVIQAPAQAPSPYALCFRIQFKPAR